MKFDIVGLDRLSSGQRSRFELVASRIVAESFVYTADRDYLTARFAFFEKQGHLFLWSAAQAVEKYLKADIVLLGLGDVKKTHKLKGMVKSLRETNPERLAVDTSIPDGWVEHGVAHWPSTNIGDFISHLENWGAPGVRYDQNGFHLNLQYLVLLDRLVYLLRDGLVEQRISDCRHIGQRILDSLYDLNFSFAPADHKHPPLKGLTLVSASVSTLEAALKGVYGIPVLYRTWAMGCFGLKESDISYIQRTAIPTSSPNEARVSTND
jgi:hypothetical protein